ncbi:hypothetical protein OAS14_02755 [Alphaproteobacteria bacterium]|nr:hypothetical protein [Alphaproteobacteria bacterium]
MDRLLSDVDFFAFNNFWWKMQHWLATRGKLELRLSHPVMAILSNFSFHNTVTIKGGN